METGMKAPGEMARSTETGSSSIVTKVRFTKACGRTEMQNVGLCLTLRGTKQEHHQSIRFHRYNTSNEAAVDKANRSTKANLLHVIVH